MEPETIFLTETDSTNGVAVSLAEQGAIDGTVVVADMQTKGRGRLGRTWQSPFRKGLYCSIIVRPQIEITDYPLITMSAGLGVVEALDEVSGVEFQLKWPNDIYRSGKKCGGILVETSSFVSQMKPFAVVGIGINVQNRNDDFPDEIYGKATSLFLESGKQIDRDVLLMVVRRKMMERLRQLEGKGFGEILELWRKKDMLSGKVLQWVTRAGTKIVGQSLGPDNRGCLHVKDTSGRIHEVLSGDINLL